MDLDCTKTENFGMGKYTSTKRSKPKIKVNHKPKIYYRIKKCKILSIFIKAIYL